MVCEWQCNQGRNVLKQNGNQMAQWSLYHHKILAKSCPKSDLLCSVVVRRRQSLDISFSGTGVGLHQIARELTPIIISK